MKERKEEGKDQKKGMRKDKKGERKERKGRKEERKVRRMTKEGSLPQNPLFLITSRVGVFFRDVLAF